MRERKVSFPKERATEAEGGGGSERAKRARSGWPSGWGPVVPLSRVARFVRRRNRRSDWDRNARRLRQRRRQIPPRSPVLCARAPCPVPRSPCSSSSLEPRSLVWARYVRVFGRSPEARFRSRDASGHRSRGQCARATHQRAFSSFGGSAPTKFFAHSFRSDSVPRGEGKEFNSAVSRRARNSRYSLFGILRSKTVAPFDRARRKVKARARNRIR